MLESSGNGGEDVVLEAVRAEVVRAEVVRAEDVRAVEDDPVAVTVVTIRQYH